LSVPRESVTFFTDRDLGKRFPEILGAGGLTVHAHHDHFGADCPDEVWLEAISKQGWVAISHDSRIRYKPNELAAVVRHRARLLVVIGKAPFAELARNFVSSKAAIGRFIEVHRAPWIAKVYRPGPRQSAERLDATGSVALWYPVP